MLAREQAELAAWAALHTRPLLQRVDTLCQDALSEYWIASRCRFDHWARELRRLGDSRTVPARNACQALKRVADEVIVSEVLTRTVATITRAHDSRRGIDESGPIGQNALAAHRETRRRLFALLDAWWPRDSEQWRQTRSAARLADRWSDSLIAHTGEWETVAPVACEADRVRELCRDARSLSALSSRAAAQLFAFSIRSSFSTNASTALDPALNRRIAGSALGLFGPSAFDSLGFGVPPWMIRVERSAEEATQLIGRLFGEDFHRVPVEFTDRWD